VAETGHHAGSFGPGRGYLQRITIDNEGRAGVSKFWRQASGWLGKQDKEARNILFWLSGPGVAEGFSEATHQLRINALLQDENSAVGESASLVFFRGSWQPDNKLVVPLPVVAHILHGASTGDTWAWAVPGRIELWDEATRLRRTTAAVAQIGPMWPAEEPPP